MLLKHFVEPTFYKNCTMLDGFRLGPLLPYKPIFGLCKGNWEDSLMRIVDAVSLLCTSFCTGATDHGLRHRSSQSDAWNSSNPTRWPASHYWNWEKRWSLPPHGTQAWNILPTTVWCCLWDRDIFLQSGTELVLNVVAGLVPDTSVKLLPLEILVEEAGASAKA